MDRPYVEAALDRKRRFKQTKTGKPREVLLPPMLCAELRDWIKANQTGPDDLLFRNNHSEP